MEYDISVIIPVYNAEKTIRKCVESLIYGQYKNLDIVLVEDCSKDESWNVCQELAKEYPQIRCFQNKKNSGVSYTRNHGLDVAKGEYIIFVDSDDWVSEKYVKVLRETAEQYPDSLTICGLHFLDNVAGYRREYVWNDSGVSIDIVDRKQFFKLPDKFMLQQLWNKIFKTSIIKQSGIRFDESISMGEDFQFVLDYMEALRCKRCVLINLPLYYYIRANNTSLMSKFGVSNHSKELKRYEQLSRICGPTDDNIRVQYENAVQMTKRNFVYQSMRDKERSKKEKLVYIEEIMQDGLAKRYYNEQIRLIIKESIAQILAKTKNLKVRVRGRIQREKNAKTIKRTRALLKNKDFSVISQNCIGGVFYHDMQLEFLSPTIDLYFEAPDFVRFVQKLRYYLDLELEMHWGEEYPVGILGDISVHFMHYGSCTEAAQAWKRRKKRINFDRIIALATDMEGFSDEVYEEWKKISYPKVLFTSKKRDLQNVVYFPQYNSADHVPDLIPKREFYTDDTLISAVNNIG